MEESSSKTTRHRSDEALLQVLYGFSAQFTQVLTEHYKSCANPLVNAFEEFKKDVESGLIDCTKQRSVRDTATSARSAR